MAVATTEPADAEQQQAHRPRLGKRALFVLCAINLIDCINVTILAPYVDALVSTILHKPRGDPSVAMWVSVLVGSYSICEVLFSGFWGMLSDRIGRRPVLLIGLAGSAVAPIIFGLAQSMPVALAARLLDGFFCGNAGITRTYLGEVVDPSNEAKAFGYLALTFSVGLFIGPLLGGLISEPAMYLPFLFRGTVFDTYPYLLPNLTYAGFAVLALIVGACALEESRPSNQPARAVGRQLLLQSDASEHRPPRSVTWSTRLIFIVSSMALLFGYSAARLQSFILVTALPSSLNGLALGPKEMGYLQLLAAFFTWATQSFLYQRGIKRFGPSRCFMGGLALTILLMLPFPAYCLLSDPAQFGAWRFLPVGLFQALSQIGFTFCFPTAFLLVNRECNPSNRGAVNGWANSISALSRGTTPFMAGALVKWGISIENTGFLGGRYLAFYMTCAIGALNVLLLAKQPPPTELAPEAPTPDPNKDSVISLQEQVGDGAEAGA